MNRFLGIAIIAAIGFWCVTSDGQITIETHKDAGFFAAGFNEGVPSFTSRNLGAHTHVPVGKTNTDRLNRSAFEFDIAGSIPGGSTVLTAVFEFECSNQGGPQGTASVDFELHRITKAWDEGTGETDVGEDTGDGITWANATSVVLWDNLGSDFDPTSFGTVLVDGPLQPDPPVTYSITSAALVAHVQDVVDGNVTDFGFLLKANPEDVDGSAARVTSREAPEGNAAKLIVTIDGGKVLLGDVDLSGTVDLLDVAPFVDRIATQTFQAEADCNEDGFVNLLDVDPFVDILQNGG